MDHSGSRLEVTDEATIPRRVTATVSSTRIAVAFLNVRRRKPHVRHQTPPVKAFPTCGDARGQRLLAPPPAPLHLLCTRVKAACNARGLPQQQPQH
ncbi:hypothetical protein HaLaN_29894 [Haematococcus lacustris]|uniref:Uncharacterized protein n=1 Tax=Haematococcus lacustris TaxID=44745 RepID=A0A6A0AFW6_HAELA|nr:hypothetical protein HaLaN_29894 [Haematococcus lacustris]